MPESQPMQVSSSDEIPALEDLDFSRLIPKLAAVAVLHHSREPLALADLAARLEQLGARLPHGVLSLRKSLASNPDPIRVREDGLLEVDPDSSELWSAVHRLRGSLREAAPSRPPAPPQRQRVAEGRRSQDSLRAAAAKWRSAVVRVVPTPEGVVGGLLCLPGGPIRLCADGDPRAFLELVSSLDLVIGLDPRGTFESLGLATRGRRFVDLTPPVLALRTPRGRSVRFTARKALRMLTGQGLHSDAVVARGAENPKGGRFLQAVLGDLLLLRTYYRFGLLHGWIPLRHGDHEERVEVAWNPGGEPTLEEILREGLEGGLAADLVLAPSANPDNPFETCWRVVPEELFGGVLDFREPTGIQAQRIGLEEILDVRLVPMPEGAVTLEAGARRSQRARRLVSRAWEASDARGRQHLVGRALEVDPECLDALIVLALDQGDSGRRVARLEEAVRVGHRQVAAHLENDLGRFWQIVETRPFMRACHALMFEYRAAGRVPEALDLAREILRLSEADELGVRYLYWSWLLEAGKDWEALRSLRDTRGERSAMYLYARTLAEFRVRGLQEARSWCLQAVEANRPFAGFLRDPKSLPGWDVDSFAPGSTEEAISLWRLYGPAWRAGGAAAVRALLEP